MTRCASTYNRGLTLAGRPIRCELPVGHSGQHGHSFAARYWDDEEVQMSELRAVKWNGADDESPDFDGFTDGETWNGFAVIYVTPEVRERVREHWYTAGTECCGHPYTDHADNGGKCAHCRCTEFDDGAANITVEPVLTDGPYTGLISLLGYCTARLWTSRGLDRTGG